MATSAVPQLAATEPARPPSAALLSTVAVVGFALAACSLALALASDVADIQVALLEWIGVPYLLAGLVAWWRRPESRLGPLMITAGLVTSLLALQFAHSHLLQTIGAVLDIVPGALFLHVYLAFPEGKLRSRFERYLVVTAYAVAIGLQLVKLSLGAYGADNLLEIAVRPGAARLVEQVQLLSFSAVCLAGIGVLAARRRRAGRARRRSSALLIDSFALGLLMVAVLFVFGAFEWPEFVAIQRATLGVIGISPPAFLLGLLDARLGQSAVGDLVVELRSDLAPNALRDALARALRDPTLTLAYWLPDFESYVDPDGRPVDVSGLDGRSATPIDRNGTRIAVLLHDRALADEPELLDAVGAAASIALENGRLQAELIARLDEVKGSRARVLEAGQKERQRLERNLHDGAQQRMVALALQLRLLEKQLADQPDARERLEEAQRELTMSLEELRDLARGIHPAVLTGRGLAVALEQVAARAPVPVKLNIELDSRLAEPVEVAAYYVVTESLANMAKHARASAASVLIARASDGLVVEVVDDGVGGADTEAGSGLRGLADRVEALGGRLRVWSPAGGGTRVKAEIPCE